MRAPRWSRRRAPAGRRPRCSSASLLVVEGARLGRIGDRGGQRRRPGNTAAAAGSSACAPFGTVMAARRRTARCRRSRGTASTCRRRTAPLPARARPRQIVMSSAATSGTPFGSRTARSSNARPRWSRRPRPRSTARRFRRRARGCDRAVEARQPLDHRAPFRQVAVRR